MKSPPEENVDLNLILGALPGVNPDDPRVKEAMDKNKKKKEGE
jgi:hypothetical protein